MFLKLIFYAATIYYWILTTSAGEKCRNADINNEGCSYVIHKHLLLSRDKAVAKCGEDGGSTLPASNDVGHNTSYNLWVLQPGSWSLCGSFWTSLSYNHSDGNMHFPNGDILPQGAWEPGVILNKSYDCIAFQNNSGSVPVLLPFDCSEELDVTCITSNVPCSCESNQLCEPVYKAKCSKKCTDITTEVPSTTDDGTPTDSPTTENDETATDEPTTVDTPRTTGESTISDKPTTEETESTTEKPVTISNEVQTFNSGEHTTPSPGLPPWLVATIVGIIIGTSAIVIVSCVIYRYRKTQMNRGDSTVAYEAEKSA